MQLATLLKDVDDIKLLIGGLVGQTKTADLLNELADLIAKHIRCSSQAVKFLLEPYIIFGEGFSIEDRSLISHRVAANIKNLQKGGFIGKWMSFAPNEEVCFKILTAKPCRIEGKVYACLSIRAESGSSAGHIHELTLSIGQCSRFAYLIGYGRRNNYDGDPRNLNFMRLIAKVQQGTSLVFNGPPYVNTFQKKHNTNIAKKRAGECPMNFGHTCVSCTRIHGNFDIKSTTCEGAVKR